MKKFYAIVIVVVLSVGTTIASNYFIDANQATIHVKRADAYSSWDSITKDSQEVVIAKVLDNTTQLIDSDVTFNITQLEVQEQIKGSLSSNSVINLLQTECAEDPKVIKDGQVLLFLEKYEGPLIDKDNVYVCKGLFDGQYRIIDDKIYPSYQEIDEKDTRASNSNNSDIWGQPNDLNTIVTLLKNYK